MKDIQLIIFDMDGVLTESSHQHFRAWKELALELGVDIDESFNERLKGLSRGDSLQCILEFAGIQEKYTEEEKKYLEEKKNIRYVELIEEFTQDNLFEGVMDLFKKLKKKNIKIAIGSASKNAPRLIKLLGIQDYIDYIVNPEEIERGKPHPDTFLKAADALGVPPNKCIGIEDAVAGIKAIKSAGMVAIGIGNKNLLWEADFVFEKIAEVQIDELLKNIEGGIWGICL